MSHEKDLDELKSLELMTIIDLICIIMEPRFRICRTSKFKGQIIDACHWSVLIQRRKTSHSSRRISLVTEHNCQYLARLSL